MLKNIASVVEVLEKLKAKNGRRKRVFESHQEYFLMPNTTIARHVTTIKILTYLLKYFLLINNK